MDWIIFYAALSNKRTYVPSIPIRVKYENIIKTYYTNQSILGSSPNNNKVSFPQGTTSGKPLVISLSLIK